ncbi:hypothetical protein D9758_013430 [Tetrapyrgos nigripes]|uniref:Uncharacterized protein n=1 Tax=Tetrapyrgos nigripes TaxID=182062 RepID=A0A8H5CK33_9AGAR|nr:hypothetical protein D9758_013430 [Tetrapyrgos nigripes]
MWQSVKGKFKVTSQVYKDLVMKKLEGTKYTDSGDFSVHLNTLTKLQKVVNATGCGIDDAKMISIVLTSLPPSWILLIQLHQGKTVLNNITAALTKYWMWLQHTASTATDPTALTTVTKNRNDFLCNNCGVHRHTHLKCWATGEVRKRKL